MAIVSLSQFARMRGVSPAAITKAVKAGRLVRCLVKSDSGGRTLIDTAIAEDEWAPHGNQLASKISSEARKRKNIASAEDASPTPASDGPPADDEPSDPEIEIDGPYFKNRAIREAYAARLAKLEFEEKSGKLRDAEAVKRAAFKTGREVRDYLLNMPDRLAAQLAAESNQFKVHAILLAEIKKSLKALEDV